MLQKNFHGVPHNSGNLKRLVEKMQQGSVGFIHMTRKKKSDVPGDESLVPGYKWIVIEPDLLGGQPTIKGTRISVAHILECLANGMSFQEISAEYGVPAESFPDAMRYAATLAAEPDRVAS